MQRKMRALVIATALVMTSSAMARATQGLRGRNVAAMGSDQVWAGLGGLPIF